LNFNLCIFYAEIFIFFKETRSYIMACADCKFRAKYDKNPKSLLGRIWRFHINFCPGWKSYLKSLSDEDRAKIVEKYGIK